MDRWQLWRRVWFRMNRKTHSRRQYQVATRTRSDPEGRQRSQPPAPPARYLMGPQHFVFVTNVGAGISQRPKVLLDVDCSDLLTGGTEDLENFSSTCWLEDHLHRFGNPSPSHQQQQQPPHHHLSTTAITTTTTTTTTGAFRPRPRLRRLHALPLPPSQVIGSFEFHGMTELETSRSSPELDDDDNGGGGGGGCYDDIYSEDDIVDDDGYIGGGDGGRGGGGGGGGGGAFSIDSEDEEEDEEEEDEEEGPGRRGVARWSPTPAVNRASNVINLHRFPYVDHQAAVPEPPPYEDEPPPSYEEAIAGDGSFQDHHLHDGTDFMW